MFYFSNDITNYFMKYLNKDIEMSEMEQWIYEKNFLAELGSDTYEFFVSLDFHSAFTERDVEEYILKLYKEHLIDLNKEKILWIVSGMANGSYDLILGCAQLSHLRSFGVKSDYIPNLFVGYDSVIEDIEHRYNDLIVEEKIEKNRLVNLYRKDIHKLSIKFLNKFMR
ncbi:hypothetical protein AMS62_20045 [Bacillus sp. FJAT-18019]|nr:hypothetical protein AMS62_20045 [Bacillus sp. FJAT-18019]